MHLPPYIRYVRIFENPNTHVLHWTRVICFWIVYLFTDICLHIIYITHIKYIVYNLYIIYILHIHRYIETYASHSNQTISELCSSLVIKVNYFKKVRSLHCPFMIIIIGKTDSWIVPNNLTKKCKSCAILVWPWKFYEVRPLVGYLFRFFLTQNREKDKKS